MNDKINPINAVGTGAGVAAEVVMRTDEDEDGEFFLHLSSGD